MTNRLDPEQIRANARYAERRKIYIDTSARPAFLKPDERAAMEEADRQYRESEEGRAVCSVMQLPFAPAAPTCETDGHEYDFGICLDCGGVDEDFDPTDAQIPGAYEIQKKAA